MWDDLFRGPRPELFEGRKQAMLRNIRKLKDLEPYIMSGRPIVELKCTDAKGRTRAVALEDGEGRKKVLVIGLGMDNECSFTHPNGERQKFSGGEFSCAIR